jgi:hypothetical protein
MKRNIGLIIVLTILLCNIEAALSQTDSTCKAVSSDLCCDPEAMAVAMTAIDSNNVEYALKWVTSEGEQETKEAFELVMKVRTLNPEVKEFSEKYFARTVARLHARYDFPMAKALAVLFLITTVIFAFLYFRKR